MAARVNKIRHDDNTRAKIQASQLVNRLQDYALNGGDLDQPRIKAIEILLRKTLPDLSAVEHSGDIALHHEQALDELDESAGASNQAETPGQPEQLRAEVPQDQGKDGSN